MTQQLVDRYGAGRVFGGGLEIETSLDMEMQKAAEEAIFGRLNGVGPSASLVAIENKTGEVKAMVGGNDFDKRPFNLATNGHRQPGSAFKPFILAEALKRGYGPEPDVRSHNKIFNQGKKNEFVVNNYEDSYAGVTTLARATATSDNSVYAELGLKVGTKRVARTAERLGIRTEVSTNPAMTLGGLKEGVTPLEMAYAYSTIANHGKRVYGTFSPSSKSPVAITKIKSGDETVKNERKSVRVLPEGVADQTRGLLHNVVTSGTGTRANIPVWAAGKTGTTENYGDAWFVGFTDRYTVAVWVGYPDKLKYMKTEYHGQPVAGGTYPAEIWRDYMMSVLKIDEARGKGKDDDNDGQPDALTPTPGTPDAERAAGRAGVARPGRRRADRPGRRRRRGTAPAPDPAPTPRPPRRRRRRRRTPPAGEAVVAGRRRRRRPSSTLAALVRRPRVAEDHRPPVPVAHAVAHVALDRPDRSVGAVRDDDPDVVDGVGAVRASRTARGRRSSASCATTSRRRPPSTSVHDPDRVAQPVPVAQPGRAQARRREAPHQWDFGDARRSPRHGTSRR